MSLYDLDLLAKKILVGIVVTAIPAVIVLGGLWATQKALQTHSITSSKVQGKHRP